MLSCGILIFSGFHPPERPGFARTLHSGKAPVDESHSVWIGEITGDGDLAEGREYRAPFSRV